MRRKISFGLNVSKKIGAAMIAIVTAAASIFAINEYFSDNPALNLTGWWNFEFNVNETTYRAFQNSSHGYRIFIGADIDSVFAIT